MERSEPYWHGAMRGLSSTPWKNSSEAEPTPSETDSPDHPAEKTAQTASKPPMVFVASPGHGAGCGHCTSMARWVPEPDVQAAKQARNQAILNQVIAHELAHQSAGGHLAGGMSIRQDSETGETEGEVPIDLPGLDKTQPRKTIADAQLVIASATAPADPSSQDRAVEAQGRSILAEAQAAHALFDQMRDPRRYPFFQNAPPDWLV